MMRKNIFKTVKILLTIGLPLGLAAFSIIGCASSGSGSAEAGTLTITGIPAEYEGKFAWFSVSEPVSLVKKVQFTASGVKPKNEFFDDAVGVVITNGSVQLPLYTTAGFFSSVVGYTGSDTIPVNLRINDTAQIVDDRRDPNFIFESVTFENGVAQVKLEDAIKVAFITITNIPPKYEWEVEAYIDVIDITKPYANVSTAIISAITGMGDPSYVEVKSSYKASANINYGTIMAGSKDRKVMAGIRETVTTTRGEKVKTTYTTFKYTSYAFTGTTDIAIKIVSDVETSTNKNAIGSVNSSKVTYDTLLFKAAQVTDGNVTLDFRQGVKQQ